MKLILIILFFVFPVFSEDSSFDKLERELPYGWTLKVEKNTLLIYRISEAFVLYENKINAPMQKETEDQKTERIKRDGKKTNCMINYSLSKSKKGRMKIGIYWLDRKDNPLCAEDEYKSIYPFQASSDTYKIIKMVKEMGSKE